MPRVRLLCKSSATAPCPRRGEAFANVRAALVAAAGTTRMRAIRVRGSKGSLTVGLLSTVKAMLPARRAGALPAYDAAGRGRRLLGWLVGNPGVNATVLDSVETLRARSRDIVRKNPWAANAVDAFVANAVGTGIKPQSIADDEGFRDAVQALWWDWCDEADAAGLTDFYGLQALACRAVLEGGECFVRLRPRRPEDALTVPLQL